mgnify:CR=1 FL=1|tara:strand:+ start:6042 stop:6740 length:699 start_codon:yes stop_codon:yes gene_type:complete
MSNHRDVRFIKAIKEKNHNNTFILLNAGAGRRTKNYGNKCLMSYEGQRIIDSQIDSITKAYSNKADIINVTGYLSDKLMNQAGNIRSVENTKYESTNVAESMRIGLNASLQGNVFFIHGDIVFSPSFIKPLNIESISIPVDSKDRINKDEVGVIISKEVVKHFSYGLTDKWCQIVFFPASFFYELRNVLSSIDKGLTTFEVLNHLIDRGAKINYFESPRGKIKEIDSMKDTK